MPYDIAGALQNPNIIGNALAASRLGRADGLAAQGAQKTNALASLAGQAYTAAPEQRNALIGQAVGIDPTAGIALDKQLQAKDTDHAKKISGAATYVWDAIQRGNPDEIEGRYQAVRPYLSELGAKIGKVPPEHYDPSMNAGIQQLIAQTGGMPAPKGVVVSSGGALVDSATGKPLYQSPDKLPETVRTLDYLQQHPELAQFDLERRKASRPTTTINTGAQENAFQKALGTKDADAYVGMREQATQAANTLQQADQIEQILSAQKTGKAQEALALAGQYFGTEAGANMQSLKGVIQPLVLSQVKQLGSGSGISDADRKFIEAGMPGFGNEPSANERVLKIMRATANRKINLYKEADSYVQKNGRLGGFNSQLITPTPPSTPRPRAVNQQTGETMEFDGTQWVPVNGQ